MQKCTLMSVRKELIMMIYITRRLLVLVLITGIFASCWDNFVERDYNSANVLTFGFDEHDTCPEIENYVFNIDQFKGLIYNLDSLPYRSVVNSLYPTLTFQSSNGEVYMNDSLWEDDEDSIDFTSPVILKNTSSDGSRTRSYAVYVNVHQVDPDSMVVKSVSLNYPTDSPKNKVIRLTDGSFRSFFVSLNPGLTAWLSSDAGVIWSQQTVSGLPEIMNVQSLCVFDSKYFICSRAGKLYVSSDGLNWNLTDDGTTFVTLFGSINRKFIYETAPAYIIGLVRNASGEICPARSSDGTSWTTGSPLDSDFPVMDYGVTKGTTATNIQFYTVATGLRNDNAYSTSIWSTENGLDWVLIQNKTNYPKLYAANKTGVSLFYYDNYMVCFGGFDSNRAFNNEIYVSKDHGKTWISAPENWIFNPLDDGIAYGCAYIERVEDTVNNKDREFILIFGGQNNSGTSPVVWKGFLNKMLFARR